MATTEKMTDKTYLSPTAALVMDLARNFYLEDDVTRRFFEHLDISSGKELIELHKTSGIYELTQELLCNRKYIVRRAILQGIADQGRISQVIILAAGKAPLALELLNRESDLISKVFEVDVASMEDKRAIYNRIAPELFAKVEFFEGDIRSPALIKELESLGFDRSAYTVIVLEGITHYLTHDELRETLNVFRSPSGCDHLIVIDFAPPFDQIAPGFEPIAREAYRIIEDTCFLKPMTKYSVEGMTKLFEQMGGEVVRHYSIHEAEGLRTGINEFFPEKNSGWLEYMVAHI